MMSYEPAMYNIVYKGSHLCKLVVFCDINDLNITWWQREVNKKCRNLVRLV